MHWHLLTGEYPPQPGGVSDYTALLALGLAESGAEVDVWCPGPGADGATPVRVHRLAGQWTSADRRRMDRELDAAPTPRRLLVQWVPQAFGRRSMNVGFCRWLLARARKGERVDIMMHETYLPFRECSWRQGPVSAAHRVMTALLLRAARRVWISTTAWGDRLRPYTFGRPVEICWLPVPSNVPVIDDRAAVDSFRTSVAGRDRVVVGHFGTYGSRERRDLAAVLPTLAGQNPSIAVVLIGRNSERSRAELVELSPHLADRIHATGGLAPVPLSIALQACDVLVQPYPDGATTRRGSLMAALAHGVAVVTTDGPLTEPLWRQSGGVRLVASDDMPGLGLAALALVGDKTARAALGQSGRRLYREQFDVAHAVHALMTDTCRPA